MGDARGFLKARRQTSGYRPVCERIKDFEEVNMYRTEEESRMQSSRCMDCGTPFCHWGCPLGNYIPEWNNFMFEKNWNKAFDLLDATNNFPEITGRICPATCEHACVLGINDDPVTIRENELAIIEYGFNSGYIKPDPPGVRTGKKVAVIGSGPAGLACAAQLNKAGHEVEVFEKDLKPGGLLRYGIPDFKLNKTILDRRIDLMISEGVKFTPSCHVGKDISIKEILDKFDSVCLACGSAVPRDLDCEGRDLEGIYFAMDYLKQANKIIAGEKISGKKIDAKDKKVVIIGGGDTGSDCVGTAHRQGASCVIQIEVMPKPPECRTDDYPWPSYPMLLKTSSSHEEGGDRQWAVLTKKFTGENGKVKRIHCVNIEFDKPSGNSCPVMREIKNSDFEIEADLVILAIGFIHPEHEGLVSQLGLELDERGNIKTRNDFHTSMKKVFSAGDMRRGQSLVVWAISEGRKTAFNIDKFLMGKSDLSDI